MGTTRRLLLVGLVVFLGFVVYRGFSTAKWTSIDTPPAGVPEQTLKFTCGAPWGKSAVTPPRSAPVYPIEGKPCGTHNSDRIMLIIDVVLGVTAIAVLLAWPRHPHDDDLEIAA